MLSVYVDLLDGDLGEPLSISAGTTKALLLHLLSSRQARASSTFSRIRSAHH
jgi:hypothetical protein